MKQFRKIVCVLLAALTLVSCGGNKVEPSADSDSAAEEEVIIEEETEEPVYLFEDAFTARRNLLNALDINMPLKFFEENSLNEYMAVRDEVNEAYNSDLSQKELEDLYRKVMIAKSKLEYIRGDTPRVYIIKDDVAHSEYQSCQVIAVSAEDDEYWAINDENCLIKKRGNSTASGPKYPYNIKFSQKVSLFGMGEGKKWTLLANLYDKSLMRNEIAYHLGQLMDIPYTSDTMFVDVYFNGEYVGNYTLCEPISVGKERVDIDEDNFEFIFEVDMNRDDGSYYFKPSIGQRMKVDKPEEVDEDSRQLITEFFDLMETALQTHDMSQYSEYIDVDSFVNFYIHSELTKSIDVYDFSTRYILKGGKLYCGALWDYDLSMGNVDETCGEDKYHTYGNWKKFGTGSGDSTDGEWMNNYWFAELLQDPEFRSKCLERFEEIYPAIENIYKTNELGTNYIDTLLEKYGASFRRNYDETDWDEFARYSGLAKNKTLSFEEEVEWLRNWLEKRTEFVAFLLLN